MPVLKRYLLYLLRWQLSTPVLAVVLLWLSNFSVTFATVVANLIGGLIFFWVDRFIFTSPILSPQWEIKEKVECVDCSQMAKGFRLVRTKNYDKTRDKHPEFRCSDCSEKKLQELNERGVQLD
ncbi:MAG: hypothetical protein Q8N93_09410 [Bacillota bacterium]|nr:hypothetical protein [Bacillota bacterium]